MMSLLLLPADPLPIGKSTVEVAFGEVQLKLFVYKPVEFHDGPMLMVFHGVLRNAEEYRDHSIQMGDRFGALKDPHNEPSICNSLGLDRKCIVN